MANIISVFTKPWKNITSEQLAEHVAGLGFTGIEFPLRTGYQAEPLNARESLPKLAKIMNNNGVAITSVASDTTEEVFAACQEAGVPLIRIMANVDVNKGYMACEAEWVSKLEAITPLCEKYNVKVGVQQHCGSFVFNTMELRHLLEQLDKRYIGGVWDAAHSGLAYENPVQALDIIRDYLFLANFKNAYVKYDNGKFSPYFTTAENGACDWKKAVEYLKSVGYEGVICMPAEYSDEENTNTHIIEDLKYLKNLLA